jgi:hypothetical protein
MPIRDTSNRPRRTGYSFANQGAATSANTGASVGKHVLRRVPGVDFWSPSWGEETVIRCFPAISPDDPSQFDPFRLSNTYCGFGDWIRVYEAVRNFGNPGVTMLLHDSMNQSYDAQLMNPCWILYRAINQALNQSQGLPEWFPLTRGSQGKGAVLSKPSKLYLVQCAIFRHKSKDTFGQGRPPLGAAADGPTIVMGLPPTAGESLVHLLEEKVEDWKGDPDDPAQYKYGDIVGIDEGGFVHIYELGKDPRARFNTSRQGASPASIYTASPTQSRGIAGGGVESKGYGVFITKTLDGSESDIPASLTGFEDLIRSKWRNWGDILEFKTDEEQAHLVAPLFPASAILYAWRDHPSWIPDSVREAGAYEARRPVSATMTPPVGGPPNPWSNPRQQVAPAAVRPSATQAPSATDQIDSSSMDENAESEPEVEGLGSDPLVEDTKQRMETARKELEAATKRRQERANTSK